MKEIMKNKMILGLSAMILASCATTQHKQDINKNINSHIEATKNTNDMDNDYLILSDGQHALINRANQFALDLSVHRQVWTLRSFRPLACRFLWECLPMEPTEPPRKRFSLL